MGQPRCEQGHQRVCLRHVAHVDYASDKDGPTVGLGDKTFFFFLNQEGIRPRRIPNVTTTPAMTTVPTVFSKAIHWQGYLDQAMRSGILPVVSLCTCWR